MAVRRPLVVIGGEMQELPLVDTLPSAGGAPGGSDTQIQYNGAGAFAGAANARVINNNLNLLGIAAPANPATGVSLFTSNRVNRGMPAIIGATGKHELLSPHLGLTKVSRWNPGGNSATVPGVDGVQGLTAVGTATARNIATTNYFTRTRRLGYVSTTTAGNVASLRSAAAQNTIGTGTLGLGGFLFIIQFGTSDAATVASARQFAGMWSSTAAPTNVEPSTLTNVIGVGHGAADANLRLFFGGSAAQASIDLGANFPKNTLSTDMYELMLYAPQMVANTVHYRVERLNTGNVAEGTLTAATAGLQLPLSTTLLSFLAWRTNNTNAAAVGLDIMSIYLESFY